MNEKTDQKLLDAGKQILVSAEQSADDELLEKLAGARKLALDAIPQQPPSTRPVFIAPYILGGATACVLAAALFIFYPSIPAEEQMVSDLELLLDAGDAEMLEEDLDFYVWLEELEDASS